MSEQNVNIDEPFNQPVDDDSDKMQALTEKIFQSGMTSSEAAELPLMVSLKETNPTVYDDILNKLKPEPKKKSTLFFGPDDFQKVFDSINADQVKHCQENEENHLDIGAEDFQGDTLTQQGADKFHAELKRQLEEAVDRKQVHHQCNILLKGFDLEDQAFFDDRTEEEIELGIEDLNLGALTMEKEDVVLVNKSNINEYALKSWIAYLQNRLSDVDWQQQEIADTLGRLDKKVERLSQLNNLNICSDRCFIKQFAVRNKLENATPEEIGKQFAERYIQEQVKIARMLIDPKFIKDIVEPYIYLWDKTLDAIISGEAFDEVKPSHVSQLVAVSELYRKGTTDADKNINFAISSILSKCFGGDSVLAVDNTQAFDVFTELFKFKNIPEPKKQESSIVEDSYCVDLGLCFSDAKLYFRCPNKSRPTTEMQWYNSGPYSNGYIENRDGDNVDGVDKIELTLSEAQLDMIKNDTAVLVERIKENINAYILPALEKMTLLLADKYTDYVTRLDELSKLDYCSKRAIQFITIYNLNEVIRVASQITMFASSAIECNADQLDGILRGKPSDNTVAISD